jgi:transcriptional regulator with XRE-family HTH domain
MAQTLGQIIREARKTKGFTQRELAEKVKKEDGTPITPQYFNDIEFDRRTPSEHVARGLAKAVDLDPDYIVVLAGFVPEDVREKLTEENVKKAMTLFRKK